MCWCWQEVKRYAACVKRHYELNVRQQVISGLYYMGVCTFLMNCCVQVKLAHLLLSHPLTANIAHPRFKLAHPPL